MKRISFVFIMVLVLGLMMCPQLVQASGVSDPLDRPALEVADPSRGVLLDVVQAGTRLVAVGERGLVILSDDDAKTWRQADKVPTSVTLCAVQFMTPNLGWAVGHAGVVLHTLDGGETWVRQLDGLVAADLALKAAEEAVTSKGAEDKTAAEQLAAARLLVADGPDKPFLDLYFKDEKTGFVVGAYGLIFQTRDGGKTWEPWMDRIENPGGYHLYCIRAVGDRIYIAGEMGLFLRSTDGGKRFEQVETPYGGSYFTMTTDAQGGIVLGGLRGNAFRTIDGGATFTKIRVPVSISFSASARRSDGSLIFANQGGFLLQSIDNGQSMNLVNIPRLSSVSALLPLGTEAVVTVGVEGVNRILLPGTDSVE
jgi:photosystem II stability/assembly factor-like uncharacterized protein